MNPDLRLKQTNGFFAAGPEMLRALRLLSDGAFKVFVHCALKASRQTGQYLTTHQELARVIGKSSRSITTYLEELVRKKVCRVEPGRNQHHPGLIEIEDPFWPYLKPDAPISSPDIEYVERIRGLFLEHPIVRSSFGEADRHLARALHRRGVPFQQVERALVLGLARKYATCLNNPEVPPITSLHYFLPLLREVQETRVSQQYWTYTANRLEHFRQRWLDSQHAAGREQRD
jgi:hypothetical protein